MTSEHRLEAGAVAGDVTLIAGTSFVVCDPGAGIVPGGLHGYYVADTRQLDRAGLIVGSQQPRLLGFEQPEPSSLETVSAVGDPTAPFALVIRTVTLGPPLVEHLTVMNLTDEDMHTTLEASFGTDFADVFEVKNGKQNRRGVVGSGPEGGALVLTYRRDDVERRVGIVAESTTAVDVFRDAISFEVRAGPHGVWEGSLAVRVSSSPHDRDSAPLGAQVQAAPVPHGELHGPERPALRSNTPGLDAIWRRSCRDLDSLRLWDADAADPVLAAGLPWFMALFGRDSLLAGMQSLVVSPRFLVGALEALARRQGQRHDARTEEAPGKLLHEVRRGDAVRDEEGWGECYYGSVDVTPLFVVACATAWRWGVDESVVRRLLVHAEAALEWISAAMSRTGFVTYPGTDDARGLRNQGWKDSGDAIRHADGTLARGPIALVEVQGYTVAAMRALADLREGLGTGEPGVLRAQASELEARIDTEFWDEELGIHAVALDGGGARCRTVTTNPGHLLWAGSLTDGRARDVSRRLCESDSYSGFGLRTLASSSRGYNPLSYHCGSVWPHDSAMIAAGMFRYGLLEDGHMVAAGLLEAARAFDGRLPELFGGVDSTVTGRPVAYPASSAPQAWAAAAPTGLVGAMLGLEPDVPANRLRLRPRLAPGMDLSVGPLSIGPWSVDLEAHDRTVTVLGAPPEVEIDVA